MKTKAELEKMLGDAAKRTVEVNKIASDQRVRNQAESGDPIKPVINTSDRPLSGQ